MNEATVAEWAAMMPVQLGRQDEYPGSRQGEAAYAAPVPDAIGRVEPTRSPTSARLVTLPARSMQYLCTCPSRQILLFTLHSRNTEANVTYQQILTDADLDCLVLYGSSMECCCLFKASGRRSSR